MQPAINRCEQEQAAFKARVANGSVLHSLAVYQTRLANPHTSLVEKAETYESMGLLCRQLGDLQKARFFFNLAIFADPLTEHLYRKRLALAEVNKLPKRTVSVVISTYNRYPDLLRTIRHVRANTFYPVEIIVVADKCDDGTVDYIRRENGLHNFIGVVNETHQGNVASLITGICRSRGDYIALIADDIQLMPGWDLEILLAIDHDTRAGCGVPLILDSGGRVESTGQHNEFLSTKFAWIGRNKMAHADRACGQNLLCCPEFQQPRECDYGFVPVLKRACLEEIGSVDGAYRHYFFDPDIGYTLQKHGWKNIYCPTSVVIHHQKKLDVSRKKDLHYKAAPEFYYFVHKWGLYLSKDGPALDKAGPDMPNSGA